MPPTRPTYLDLAPEPVEALFHPAESPDPGVAAVLICPPWGWDEVASYRSRRKWAQRLTAAGHPTLRYAPPATGNSAGSPGDPARLEAWVGALTGATDWLRAATGRRVAVLGLGLGGLIAREAIARGARIEELILWGAPASGRAFVRETQAFSRMQAWNGSAANGSGATLPEGWLEAGGFVLSKETIESLSALRPAIGAGAALDRVLLLERDGLSVDEGLLAGLEDAGVEVTVAPGDGWSRLVSHAERTVFPETVGETVEQWLSAVHNPAAGPPGSAPAELEELILNVEGREVRESTVLVPQQFGQAFGVLSEPADGDVAAPFCALFLNAGAVRNIGPNRLWVETGRRWAAQGVRTLRVDLEGIGEADGAAPADVAAFYLPKFERQLGVVIDGLQERGLCRRFLVVGLCGGGYWAFREALRDPRVDTALLLNSGALEWDTSLIEQREARKISHASSLSSWKRLLRGEFGLRKVGRLARSLLVQAGRALGRMNGRLSGREPAESRLEAALDSLRDAETALTVAFSEREPLLEELEADGTLARLSRWPNVELARLPGDDHTLRPIAAQVGVRELLDRELERAIARSGTTAPSGPPSGVSEAGRAPGGKVVEPRIVALVGRLQPAPRQVEDGAELEAGATKLLDLVHGVDVVVAELEVVSDPIDDDPAALPHRVEVELRVDLTDPPPVADVDQSRIELVAAPATEARGAMLPGRQRQGAGRVGGEEEVAVRLEHPPDLGEHLQPVLVAHRVDAVEAEEDEVEGPPDAGEVPGIAEHQLDPIVAAEQLGRVGQHPRRVVEADVAADERRERVPGAPGPDAEVEHLDLGEALGEKGQRPSLGRLQREIDVGVRFAVEDRLVLLAHRGIVAPLHVVGGGQLRVLRGQHFGQLDHHLALLPGGVVLHLAVDHVDAATVGDRLQHLLGEPDLLRRRAEDLLGDVDLHRVQRPGADATHQEGGAELGLASGRVLDVAEGAVEGQDAGRGAGVDHAGDRVVPEVLLGADPVGLRVLGIGRVLHHAVAGMPAADPRGLHPPRGGEVGRAEAHPLHARAGGGDLLQVDDALRGLEDRVDQDRPLEAGLRLELGQQPVDVVDVPGALDLGDHHDLELVADLADQRLRSSSTQGLSSELTLVQSEVGRSRTPARPGSVPGGRPPCGRPGSRPRGCRAGCRSSWR